VEFAKYYRTNLSNSGYASSAFSSLNCNYGFNSFGFNYSWLTTYVPVIGYSHPFGYSPYSYSGLGFGNACGGGSYYGGYFAYRPFVPQQAPPITGPLQRPSPYLPVKPPLFPRVAGQLPDGSNIKPVGTPTESPSLQPAPRLRATDELLTPRDAHTSNGYRQRGLITDEDGMGPTTTSPRIAGEAQRPSIVDMVGRRRQEMGDQGVNSRTERYGQPRNARESIDVPRGSYRPHDGSSYPAAGVSAPRGGEARQFNPSYGSPRAEPRSEPRSQQPSGGGGAATHASPSAPPPHIERPSSPPPSSPRAEPASKPNPHR
jgi:hypothetical protein